MILPDHLAELAVAIETSTTQEEAFEVVETFLRSATAKQISARGHKQSQPGTGKCGRPDPLYRAAGRDSPPTATVGGLLMAVLSCKATARTVATRTALPFPLWRRGAACLLTVRAPLVDEINRMGSK